MEQFTGRYRLSPTSRLQRLPGNFEPDLERLFMKFEGDQIIATTEIRDFIKSGSRIDRQCYFESSRAPLIDIADWRRGTCIEDVFCLNAHFDFGFDGDSITISPHRYRPVNRNQYQQIISRHTLANIEKIYKDHGSVHFLYSGGIDSLFILAAISYLGLMPRTTLISVYNECSPENLRLDASRLDPFRQSVIYAKAKGAESKIISFTPKDFCMVLLKRSYRDTTEYLTSWLLDQYHNQCFLIGLAGNHVLLHKDFIAKEIQQTDIRNSDTSLCYMKGIDLDQVQKRPMHTHFLLIKKQHAWNKNSNKILAPLADRTIFDAWHGLNLSDFSVEDAVDVAFAREIIREWDPAVCEFISTECVKEYDALSGWKIAIDDGMLSSLQWPDRLPHHPDGLDYLKYEMANIKHSGQLSCNFASTINLMQWLGS